MSPQLLSFTRRATRRLALSILCLAPSMAPRVYAQAQTAAAHAATEAAASGSAAVARYHAVAFVTDMDADRFTRAVGLGALWLDPATSAFHVEVSESRMELVQSCPAPPDLCRRSIRSRQSRRLFETAGHYRRVAPGQIVFDLTADGGAVESVTGYTDAAGSVIVVPFPRGNGVRFLLALAERPDAPAWPSGRYAWSQRVADFSDATVGARNEWRTHATGIAAGTVQFAGHTAHGALSGSQMWARVACRGEEAACTLAATLESAATFGAVGGRVGATPDGGLRLDGLHDGARYEGYADPSASLVALVGAGERGRQSLSLLTRRGTAASVADLQGEYSVVTLEEFLDTEAHVRTFQPTGTLSFDGAGHWSFNGANTVVDRADCAAAPVSSGAPERASCGTAAINTLGPVNAGAAGGYTVSLDGDMTQQGIDTGGGAVNFTGSVSSDGRIFLLRRVEDALPCTFFCLGHESVRSLVIGIRKQ
jgi:hypothetical protein